MYDRFSKSRIEEALADTRVVLISGPRQSGKTTLATDIAADKIPLFTLDDATVLAAANDDPVGFLRGLDRAVIDEIQRAPDLLLSIKTEVDRDKSPGCSQKSRRIGWTEFKTLTARFPCQLCVSLDLGRNHGYDADYPCVASGAGNPPARICEGGGGMPGPLNYDQTGFTHTAG